MDSKPVEFTTNTFSLPVFAQQKHLDGKVCGVVESVTWLEDQAVLHFRTGRDADAKVLREIASKMSEDLRVRLMEEAEQHATKHGYPEKGRLFSSSYGSNGVPR